MSTLLPFRLEALGTTIEGVLLTDDQARGEAIWQDIRDRIERFANRFSRFLPASELSQVNSRPGVWVTVSPEMAELLRTAQEVWQKTHHLIDPTIGYALIHAGYDRSFEKLKSTEHRPRPSMKMVHGTLDLVQFDLEHQRVQVPIGVSLDFGGLGKGYLLDQLAPLIAELTTNYWLSLGGDMIVSGTDATGQPWPIAVQDPRQLDKDWARLVIPRDRVAVATSGTTKRQGTRNGQHWHHIIDPRTGRPSTSDVIAATVVTDDGLWADAYAKTVLLQGATEGLAWAESQPGVEALIITHDGKSQQTSGIAPWLQLL